MNMAVQVLTDSELQLAGAEALKEVMKWLTETKNFVTEQAPLLAQEYLRFNRTIDITGIVISSLTLIIGIVAIAASIRYEMKQEASERLSESNRYKDYSQVCACIGIPSVLGGVVAGACFTYDLMQVTMAPRVYVLEGIKSLIQ
jgi:hypothetical protein